MAAGIEIVGPAPLPFYKLRGHFRWHLMLKLPPFRTPGVWNGTHPVCDKRAVISDIYRLLMSLKKPSAVAFAMDVDPLNIL